MFRMVSLISQVNVQMMRFLKPTVKSMNISVPDLILLWNINNEKQCRATDFAKWAGVPPSTLTSAFDRFVAMGYIARVHDSEDRRSVLVKATPQLEEMLEIVIKDIDQQLMNLSLPQGFVERLMEDLFTLGTYILQQNDDKQRK